MKELQQNGADSLSVVAEKQIEKKKKFLGTIRKIRGLKLYKLSLKTGEISEVKLEKTGTAKFTNVPQKDTDTVKIEEHYLYEQALNNKNAKRKFQKRVNEIIARG